MYSSLFYKSISFIFILVFIIIFTFYVFSFTFSNFNPYDFTFSYNHNKFIWPLPNNSYISSYFGYRKSPTAGASTYHSGVDIPAAEGTEILSICSGTVSYVGFKGAGGYTITIVSDEYIVSYCHLSPILLVSKNDYVIQGKVIATVGPKYVYNVIGNPYKDSHGKPTNGATTGPHLHLSIRKDGQAVNPLNYISSSSSL